MADTIIIEGETNTRNAATLVLRSALKLEKLGMKKRGQSARSMAVIFLTSKGVSIRSNAKVDEVYTALNTYIETHILPPQNKMAELK